MRHALSRTWQLRARRIGSRHVSFTSVSPGQGSAATTIANRRPRQSVPFVEASSAVSQPTFMPSMASHPFVDPIDLPMFDVDDDTPEAPGTGASDHAPPPPSPYCKTVPLEKWPKRYRPYVQQNPHGVKYIDGVAIASALRKETILVSALVRHILGRYPCLSVVRVGNDPASASYLASLTTAANACQLVVDRPLVLEDPCATSDVVAAVRTANADPNVDSILVQMPLPSHIDQQAVIAAIDPVKDLEGAHPANAGKLFLWRAVDYAPCTPRAVMRILQLCGVRLAGLRVAVVGLSKTVGLPLALLLAAARATPILCDRHTRCLSDETSRAEVVITATGQRGVIRAHHVRRGAIVIDVGMVLTPAMKLEGDAHEGVAANASAVTPVPGGVGPVTVITALINACTNESVVRGFCLRIVARVLLLARMLLTANHCDFAQSVVQLWLSMRPRALRSSRPVDSDHEFAPYEFPPIISEPSPPPGQHGNVRRSSSSSAPPARTAPTAPLHSSAHPLDSFDTSGTGPIAASDAPGTNPSPSANTSPAPHRGDASAASSTTDVIGGDASPRAAGAGAGDGPDGGASSYPDGSDPAPTPTGADADTADAADAFDAFDAASHAIAADASRRSAFVGGMPWEAQRLGIAARFNGRAYRVPRTPAGGDGGATGAADEPVAPGGEGDTRAEADGNTGDVTSNNNNNNNAAKTDDAVREAAAQSSLPLSGTGATANATTARACSGRAADAAAALGGRGGGRGNGGGSGGVAPSADALRLSRGPPVVPATPVPLQDATVVYDPVESAAHGAQTAVYRFPAVKADVLPVQAAAVGARKAASSWLVPRAALEMQPYVNRTEFEVGMRQLIALSDAAVAHHTAAVSRWLERMVHDARIEGQLACATQDRRAFGALFDFMQVGGYVDAEAVVRLMENALLSQWEGQVLDGRGSSATATKLVYDVMGRVRVALYSQSKGDPTAAHVGGAHAEHGDRAAAVYRGGSGVGHSGETPTGGLPMDSCELWDTFQPGRVLLNELEFVDALLSLRDMTTPVRTL